MKPPGDEPGVPIYLSAGSLRSNRLCRPRKRIKMGNIFIERSISAALNFFKEAVFSEEIARSRGFLQSIGPKTKLAMLAFFVFGSCLTANIWILAILYLLSAALALVSAVNYLYFLKRVWFFIPLFTVVIAIPAFFAEGPYTALLFILRVATCVSFVVLVTITTPHNKLLKALRSIGIPAIFVTVLDMTYRYIFFLIKVFEEIHLALKSRLVKKISGREGRGWVASRMAFLFKRSLRMSEDVYMAMLARGYDPFIAPEGKRKKTPVPLGGKGRHGK
jgi:cobalt/nickel transport system permease protein